MRRTTTQDVSWFLDLNRQKTLDLSPSYQRRSAWTRKDQRFFLDTIFRDYPCPPIFVYKDLDVTTGVSIYRVVDGKQRLETILDFYAGKIALAPDYGDTRFNGKKFEQLDEDAKKHFWDYVVPVEHLSSVKDLNEVFTRFNRNSRRLVPQELRRAKYDGWFIKVCERESEQQEWKDLHVVTLARAKRMQDVQYISEMFLVILDGVISGLDRDELDLKFAEYDDGLDDKYAEYDEPSESNINFSEEDFYNKVHAVKSYLLDLEKTNGCIAKYAKTYKNFYSLFAFVALHLEQLPVASDLASKYANFMEHVLAAGKNALSTNASLEEKEAYRYFVNAQGASTDLKPRQERGLALSKILLPTA